MVAYNFDAFTLELKVGCEVPNSGLMEWQLQALDSEGTLVVVAESRVDELLNREHPFLEGEVEYKEGIGADALYSAETARRLKRLREWRTTAKACRIEWQECDRLNKLKEQLIARQAMMLHPV